MAEINIVATTKLFCLKCRCRQVFRRTGFGKGFQVWSCMGCSFTLSILDQEDAMSRLLELGLKHPLLITFASETVRLLIPLAPVSAYLAKNPRTVLALAFLVMLSGSWISVVLGDPVLANDFASYSFILLIASIATTVFFDERFPSALARRILASPRILLVVPFQLLMISAIVSLVLNDASRATTLTVYAIGALVFTIFVSIFVSVKRRKEIRG